MQMVKIRTKQALPATPYGAVFSKAIWRTEKMLKSSKTALLSLFPQQTHFAAVRVKGERLEEKGRGSPLVDGSVLHPETICSDTHTRMYTRTRTKLSDKFWGFALIAL